MQQAACFSFRLTKVTLYACIIIANECPSQLQALKKHLSPFVLHWFGCLPQLGTGKALFVHIKYHKLHNHLQEMIRTLL